VAFLARAVLPGRALAAAALLSLALALLLSRGPLAEHPAPVPAVRPSGAVRTGLSRLPPAARGPVSAAMGADSPAYRIATGGEGLQANNPAQHIGATFTAGGLVLRSDSVWTGLRLAAVGYGAALAPIAPVAPSARGNRVRYTRAGVSEWYANGPLGIEQGFTVARRPAGDRAQPLTLSLSLSTAGARASLTAGGRAVVFGSGASSLRYSQLSAIDARGHALGTHLALDGDHLLLRIDTRGARFPVRIDPLIQQGGKLTASDATGASLLGSSVALSADGNTALIGGPEDEAGGTMAGAAWVFTRTGSTWTQQGPKLTGSDEQGPGQFGISVALSADGNTALIGGIEDQTKGATVGAAWAFVRAGSTWTQQGPKLTGGIEENVGGRFGRSVALSATGNTALIGAYFDDSTKGSAFVFTRSGTTWAQQGKRLLASDESGEGQFGVSAALSSDGNTALIGGPHDEGGKAVMVGAAWVFVRSGSTWSQQGGKLAGAGEEGPGELGSSAALSAGGDIALLGGPGDGTVGAAWAFARSGSTWNALGAKLVPSDATGASGFGGGVALSADGAGALIGGPVDAGAKVPEGAAWEFLRTGTGWTQQGAKFRGAGQVGEGEFGLGVAMSADGDTAMIGAPLDATDHGSAFAFINPPPSVTTSAATAVGFTSATLNGLLGAGASNTAHFEYGGTTAYGSSTIASSLGASTVSRTLATGLSGLPLGTTIHFRLVAENSAGRSLGADQSFTTGFPIGKQPAPLPRAPVIEGVSQSHSTWRVGHHAARLARRHRPPLGTTFSVRLNETASLSLTFTQRVAGRRVGRRCVAPGTRNRHHHACKRTVTRGTLTLAAHAGLNRVLFQGVLAHGRTLSPGTYTVLIGARNTTGLRAATRSLSFRIVR
jgi:FG-GAP repeat